MSDEKGQSLTECTDCEFHCRPKDTNGAPSKEDQEAADMYLENFQTSSEDVKSFLRKLMSVGIFQNQLEHQQFARIEIEEKADSLV